MKFIMRAGRALYMCISIVFVLSVLQLIAYPHILQYMCGVCLVLLFPFFLATFSSKMESYDHDVQWDRSYDWD